MKYVTSIIVKYLAVAVILEIILKLMTSLTFGQILIVSAAVTVVSYLLADLLVLSVSNNAIATVADLALNLFTIYMFNYWSTYPAISFAAAITSAIVLGIGEWFFHKYMVRSDHPDRSSESK